MKKTKKGFTIVELIIVIAVIAVLTAILVPTFIHLTKKANEAADHSLVTNLNKALAMREAEEGEKGKNNTMYDCVMDLDQEGYKLPQLATRSDEDLVWSQQINRFFLSSEYNAEKHGGKYNCWHIYEQMPTEQTWAIYPNEKWTTADVENLKVGFDAGKAEVKSVLYKGEAGNTVVIRTNGEHSTLTVNAPEDSVKHYGVLDSLTITAVKGSSYHEYGRVRGGVTISQGHIEIEKGAEVSQVDVKNATGAVKVTANEGTLINVDSASTSQTAVVANSQDIYVTGVEASSISGSQASNVEFPTVVTSEAELTAALDANEGFIQLGASFDVNKSYPIAAKTLIDFKGYMISAKLIGTSQADFVAAVDAQTAGFEFVNTPLFRNANTLSLMDSTQSGNGGVTSVNNIIIDNIGTLTINGVKLSGNLQIHKYYSGEGTSEAQDDYRNSLGIQRGVIRNEATGKLLIKSVDLYTKSDYGIFNKGEAIIEDGLFTSDSSYARGGYAYCVTNDNKMTINGGTVLGDHGAVAGNAGTLVINNVTAKAKQFYGLYAAGERGVASCVVNNGSFESEKQSAVLVGNSSDGGLGLPADVVINNGVFKGSTVSGKNPAVRTSKQTGGGTYGLGFITINGGKFNSDVSSANGVNTCVQGSDGLWVVNQ